MPVLAPFVRHIAGWYAQKHPDEDFAETFAVWLTPRSQWRKRYEGWGALAKLRYVDRMARRLRDVEPVRPHGDTDMTVDEMETTVEDFYRKALAAAAPVELALDTDLSTSSRARAPQRRACGRRPTSCARTARPWWTRSTYWTGVQRPLVKRLVESIEARVGELGSARRRATRTRTWRR